MFCARMPMGMHPEASAARTTQINIFIGPGRP
jgi:hypothetical protein